MSPRALLLALLAATPAAAQGLRCADRDALAAALKDRWGESRVAVGLDARGRMIEVWADPQDGSWTITLSLPEGPTCMIADGTAYEAVEPEPEGTAG